MRTSKHLFCVWYCTVTAVGVAVWQIGFSRVLLLFVVHEVLRMFVFVFVFVFHQLVTPVVQLVKLETL